MRYRIFLTAVLLFGFVTTRACDICGCGVGNNYIGILPDFQKHIAGFRYRYNSLYTHLGQGGAFTHLTTKENYSVLEAWTGWTIHNRFRILMTLPYSFNERINQESKSSKSGISDITVNGYYQLLNSRQTVAGKILVQSLWAGIGLKAATGKYDPADKSSGAAAVNLFQLGTGSNDLLLHAMYDLRIQDAGVNVATSYKVTSKNRYDYAYGNKLAVNAQFYYKVRIAKKLTVAPNAGMQWERSGMDRDAGFRVYSSGGNLLAGTAGCEFSVGHIAIGSSYQRSLHQDLGNGMVKANNRFMLHMAVVF